MTEPKKLGMLTPSSNTVLEPICSSMLHQAKGVTCHYSRFPVTKISLDADSLNQFDFTPMLRAAELLAHAEVDLIAWNGTSGGWLGFDVDHRLCEKITQETGIAATTSMLAQLQAFQENQVKSVHLVTPYIPGLNDKICQQYQEHGIKVIGMEGLAQTVNRTFSQVSEERIERMIQNVTENPADGISIVCTNFPAMWKVEYLEETYRHTIYDTIAVVVWEGLKRVGLDPREVKGWGRLFR